MFVQLFKKPSSGDSASSASGAASTLRTFSLSRSLIPSRSSIPSNAPTSPSHRSTSSIRHLSRLTVLRDTTQSSLSRHLHRLIKSTNKLVAAHKTSSHERADIAVKLSEWGKNRQSHDPAVSDISDKLGVVLMELGAVEEEYAHGIDDARQVLKVIRNTEQSVKPSREARIKIAGDIQRVRGREPMSSKLAILEQELVRAEAENLVAEAQLTNITREKLKEAYHLEFAAIIERAEKEIILASHGARLLDLIDDTPVMPGDMTISSDAASGDSQHPCHSRSNYNGKTVRLARDIINDIEDDLNAWPDATSSVMMCEQKGWYQHQIHRLRKHNVMKKENVNSVRLGSPVMSSSASIASRG